MRNVYDIAYELANALKESNEFKRFKAAKEKIEKDEKLKQMVMDFKKKQLELEQKRLQGQEVTSSDVYSLQQLYQIISLNPDIEEYLSSEMMLAKILADISKIIAEAVDLKDEMFGLLESK
ncbi:protein of unknown function DUF964 [Caldicellulosiruptor saccharolyticus DSM 8903]|uniref:UPF0342 protein Csac_0863 n=1 Tax=Caldicellulosiruptor saccharolyticus (strain ATCC 43494 / DSM 8903 / Tp8T 6331) TaxID=351627 RepID=Y863_CALS8|nr:MULTISPECIES: YlbF family regulator [Caldicellulosiruptor]A4XHU4.1 RecName: Full=UPF0342 protein Csac_0863 [Caldicellulosiruptor saccharolyticus DSM 8903]ABP66479.1 protein of unknown function DUF964 [Caldicellulosiruptor saccharolyticus DSM 8903]